MVIPAAVLPPVLVQNVVTPQFLNETTTPVTHDPRDAKITLSEAALQSLQSAVDKMQSTSTIASATASLQHRPALPMQALPPQYAATHAISLRPELNH